MFSPGIEPGLRPSQSRVRIHHTPRTDRVEGRELRVMSSRRRFDCPTTLNPPSASPGSRTPSCGFEDRRASITLARLRRPVSRPGFEPGPGPSESPMQSATPSGRHECKDSNPVGQFWRLTALPGAHSSSGCPRGIEPPPSASQTDVQEPLHYGHHLALSAVSFQQSAVSFLQDTGGDAWFTACC